MTLGATILVVIVVIHVSNTALLIKRGSRCPIRNRVIFFCALAGVVCSLLLSAGCFVAHWAGAENAFIGGWAFIGLAVVFCCRLLNDLRTALIRGSA